MCGNPPWDKLQMEDEKWFVGQDESIVKAANQAARNRLISKLERDNPELYEKYMKARHKISSQANFIKNSGRFPLTAVGKIDLYPLFAEHCLNCSREAWGLVLPTGIAVNDSTKDLFAKLVDENRLISMYDFVNREKLFDIASLARFCLLTAGCAQNEPRNVSGGFYLTRLDHLLDPSRIYTLDTQDFIKLNPNTKNCPVFRTSHDAALTAKIYKNTTILLNENNGNNPWDIRLGTMFNMATSSYLFRTREQLHELHATQKGNHFFVNGEEYVPLYEGKMIWHYNHHFGTIREGTTEKPARQMPIPRLDELKDPNHNIMPWYWVPLSETKKYLQNNSWKHSWLIGFRDVTNATHDRTFVVSLMPSAIGAGHKAPLVFTSRGLIPSNTLLALLSSLVFDYVSRQKVGGSSMSFFIVKQLPVLSPCQIELSGWQQAIVERVARLCWFNHDLDGWMEELRKEAPAYYNLPVEPVIWNEENRALWQAELDAIFAHLYGLSTEDLCYILDPEDVCGPGCINETFRVLKEREMRELGEYRTKRLVMKAWKKFGFE